MRLYKFFFTYADEFRQTCVKEDINKGHCKDVHGEEACYEEVVYSKQAKSISDY